MCIDLCIIYVIEFYAEKDWSSLTIYRSVCRINILWTRPADVGQGRPYSCLAYHILHAPALIASIGRLCWHWQIHDGFDRGRKIRHHNANLEKNANRKGGLERRLELINLVRKMHIFLLSQFLCRASLLRSPDLWLILCTCISEQCWYGLVLDRLDPLSLDKSQNVLSSDMYKGWNCLCMEGKDSLFYILLAPRSPSFYLQVFPHFIHRTSSRNHIHRYQNQSAIKRIQSKYSPKSKSLL